MKIQDATAKVLNDARGLYRQIPDENFRYRLTNAVKLWSEGAVSPLRQHGSYAIASQRGSGVAYRAERGGECLCMDWQEREGWQGYCKHLLAVELACAVGELLLGTPDSGLHKILLPAYHHTLLREPAE